VSKSGSSASPETEVPVADDTSEPSQPVAIKLSRPTRRASGSKGPEVTEKDREVAMQLLEIQQKCRKIDDSELVETAFPAGGSAKLYRPKVEITTHQGQQIYAYPSLLEGDGHIGLRVADYDAYLPGGGRALQHMDFVSQSAFDRVVNLLRQYTFYSDKCSYPDCVYNVKGRSEFTDGIRRKANMIIRNMMLPPAAPTPRGSTAPVMELKRMCYVHWLLSESRDIIQEKWMQITVDLQGLPAAEFRPARVERFVGLINEIHDAVQQKAKDGGERAASKEEIGEMLVSFATEIQKGQ
jgi:hypothetical protein